MYRWREYREEEKSYTMRVDVIIPVIRMMVDVVVVAGAQTVAAAVVVVELQPVASEVNAVTEVFEIAAVELQAMLPIDWCYCCYCLLP